MYKSSGGLSSSLARTQKSRIEDVLILFGGRRDIERANHGGVQSVLVDHQHRHRRARGEILRIGLQSAAIALNMSFLQR